MEQENASYSCVQEIFFFFKRKAHFSNSYFSKNLTT